MSDCYADAVVLGYIGVAILSFMVGALVVWLYTRMTIRNWKILTKQLVAEIKQLRHYSLSPSERGLLLPAPPIEEKK